MPHKIRRDADGVIEIDQGVIYGFPVSYNPDDELFYVHTPGAEDGTNVLTYRRQWQNLV